MSDKEYQNASISGEESTSGDLSACGKEDVTGDASAWQAVKEGKVPSNVRIVRKLTVGVDFLERFIKEQYLEDYIPQGGSKMKFVTGRAGSGKTHLLTLLEEDARDCRFLTVSISARNIWLHDFREIYLEILRQCDILRVLRGCAGQIIREMGYDPSQIRGKSTFMDFLSDRGEGDMLSKGTIRESLREMFTRNPRLDNNFAQCCMLLTGSILGHPTLEEQNADILLSFLRGDKSVKLSQFRQAGLIPARITKYNARHMLRSLTEVVHQAGFSGICVLIDDMEALLNRSSSEKIRYTKLRRDDTYENIRQLIDDIDTIRYIMFLFSFDRELIDNESYGMKTYQALWMRIQKEVSGMRFNRFADMIDLDQMGDQVYTPQVLVEMSRKLTDYANEACCRSTDENRIWSREQKADNEIDESGKQYFPISMEEAEALIEKSEYGNLGLPYLVNHAVIYPEKDGKKDEGGMTDV